MTMGKLFDKLLNRKKERHPRCAALVPAAGRSERMGGTDKLTAPLCGVPVLLRTLRALDEAALIDEYPEFGLESRKLLDKIDYEAGTVVVDGVEYPLTDRVFPTVDPQNPFALTPAEEEVMCRLEAAFTGCEKLQRHMRFFLEVGSL